MTARDEMLHGKFIPNEPHPLPLPIRLLIGVGVGLGIAVLIMLSVNLLNSCGVWVTLLLVSVIAASALVLWIRDSVKYPATSFDNEDDGEG